MAKIKKNVTFFPYNIIDISEKNTESNQKFTFKNLGVLYTLLIQHNDSREIVGRANIILREYVFNLEKLVKKINFWYFCDINIDQNHHGQKIINFLFNFIHNKLKLTSKIGYFISPDPVNDQTFHILKKCEKIFNEKFATIKILIYSVTKQQLLMIEKYFKCAYGNVSYLLMDKLYHLQHSRFAASENIINIELIPELSIIMFCFPVESTLENILNDLDIKPKKKVSIFFIGMKFFDWHEILTSDIYDVNLI
ncbi:hypothetical protein QLL95_gp0883 [Cotonvirus japonicus]|uniref:Uncharacterized protein n=1 Tax=Cotonvirus japonicus TaxID=2811091 RepID=A0ABM7NSU4_9VIRU|nr:hypothetical protein QLL95_gp0883 [Cotonvirus japonicus]BCS83240.1 hypothetical protein [Cotonvirus japonicus]